ncbi:MAG: matrixin family metalloprotease [Acidobacteria bacterium]|nr:matrixin family metalloprotease [Acidobacteriota bacterium]MSO82316.1 matrixin family metalloprotease [Acidobacteriota bacterium]
MNARRRTSCGALAALLLCVTTMESPRGFALLANKWPNGTVTMQLQLQLGPASGTLIDGATSFNQVAASALSIWNNHSDLVKFAAVQNSTVPRVENDGVNSVFFDSTEFGRRFEGDTLAIATSWYRVSTGAKLEGDVVFNSSKTWNSYRGALRQSNDFNRVALHEFGHILGLDHPDEKGQRVAALMNSEITGLDALTADDIAGGRALYGSGGVTSNISFPPRNEPNDFFNQLIAVYQNQLRAGPVTTYVDPEGIVVWLIEYARYRVGLCDHSTSQTRVFSAIDNTGVYGVCALTPSGTIPFPSRNEGLNFMNALQVKYRDDLRRGAGSSFVDNEGAVVWVLEYLRYRLNACGHGDASTKVFMQIRGQGIQPVCR